jgi:hypothetical protein
LVIRDLQGAVINPTIESKDSIASNARARGKFMKSENFSAGVAWALAEISHRETSAKSALHSLLINP